MSTVTPYLNLVKPAPLENFSRATYNNNLDLIDANANAAAPRLQSASKLGGIQGNNVTWGTAFSTASDMKFYIGSVVLTTDASGYIAVDFPTGFLTGYIVNYLLNGDVAAQSNINIALSTGIFTNTSSRFYIRVMLAHTNAPLVSCTFRVNFRVEGA